MPNSITQFIENHNIRFSCVRVDSRPDGLMDGVGQRHFKCRISVAGTRAGFSLYFSQGSAHKADPTASDVLGCLASDADGYVSASGFEDWASEFGYGTDSRSAEKIYRTVKRQADTLQRVLGDDVFQELLYSTERE